VVHVLLHKREGGWGAEGSSEVFVSMREFLSLTTGLDMLGGNFSKLM